MSSLKKDYYEYGFCIARKIIDSKLVFSFFESLHCDLYNSGIMIPQMDTQQFGAPSVDSNGFLINPIADIHLIKYVDGSLIRVWETALNILTNKDLISTINYLTNAKEQALVMSMFFDKNAGTPAHQDCYYLDTLPPRKLIAAWIALEDINEAAGRFFVIPKSQEIYLNLDSIARKDSNKYEQLLKHYMENERFEIVAPALQKGDVLFWNSGTIHGSLETQDNSFSRKSFTCHFVPSYCNYVQSQYDPAVRPLDGFNYNGVLCRITNSINKERVRHDLVSRSQNSFNR